MLLCYRPRLLVGLLTDTPCEVDACLSQAYISLALPQLFGALAVRASSSRTKVRVRYSNDHYLAAPLESFCSCRGLRSSLRQAQMQSCRPEVLSFLRAAAGKSVAAAVAPLLSHRLHRSLACRSACWRTSWCSNRSAGPGAAAAALLACRRCSAPRMPSAGGRLRAAAVTLHNANAHAAVWFDNEHR